MKRERVIVAMSGGVDSSVAAALLCKQGFDVIGITMKTWGFMEVGGAPKYESGCCSLDAIFDAKNVAALFGFPHYTVDFTKQFEDTVINNFVDEYLHGRTPNPCVVCNRKIKWEELLKKADSLDAKFVATGHYASTFFDEKYNRFVLKKSSDLNKDQTYALWGLTQVDLSRTLFPLANYSKPEVRKIANELGIKSANKPDSQEICFVADNDYERFIKEKIPDFDEKIVEGDYVYQGEIVGHHKGIPFYTIGQRRGLGVAVGSPLYVRKIITESNTIELGNKNDLLQSELTAEDVNFISKSKLSFDENVICKIRYSDFGSNARIIDINENSFSIKFEKPKSAITPGQSVVLYDDEGYVLAGGIINEAK